MGWEIWHDSNGQNTNRIGFFCNTADVSFGPVIYTDGGFDKSEFYTLWDKANLGDARSMDEGELSTHGRHLVRLGGWEDLLIITMSVYHSDGKNVPVKIYEKLSKECFQNCGQSPYQPELESRFDSTEVGEKQWDFITEAVEELNEQMKIMVIQQDENTKVSQEYMGLTVVFEWEVIDE
jgi:hypothetical protein|tara:strand:+ start:3732 stop:4268 length:537 start_codon:yes stop_codon:yes gene_type:complete